MVVDHLEGFVARFYWIDFLELQQKQHIFSLYEQEWIIF